MEDDWLEIQFDYDHTTFPVLACPICNFGYNHPGKPEVVAGNDNYDTKMGVRGDVIIIPFVGECGHNWELCIGFHKGNTFIFARKVEMSQEKEKEIRSHR